VSVVNVRLGRRFGVYLHPWHGEGLGARTRCVAHCVTGMDFRARINTLVRGVVVGRDAEKLAIESGYWDGQ